MRENNLKNLTIEADHVQEAQFSEVSKENEEPKEEDKQGETTQKPIVKKTWLERQADKAYERRVKKAEKKLQKEAEKPPKKTFKEKVKETGPKIVLGVAVVGGAAAALIGGAVAYNNSKAQNQANDEADYNVTFDDEPQEIAEEIQPNEEEEAQEA